MTDVDFLDEIKADAVPVPRDEQLATVAFMAQCVLAGEERVAVLEAALKEAKDGLRQITETDLPEAMNSLGLREFKLTDGSKITVKPYYSMSIPEENREEAWNWLENRGHGDIVKHVLSIETRLSSDQLLSEIRELAIRKNLDVSDKLGVHHMTGSAFVRRQLEAGKDLPREMLGISTGFRAKVEGAK